MTKILMIVVFANLLIMIFRNCRAVLGVVAPAIIMLLSLFVLLVARFSVTSLIIAIYINLILFLFSVFVIVRVTQRNAGGLTDDFMEYWQSDDNVMIQVRTRVFTTRVTKMVVWQRDKGCCVKCGLNQNLEFKYNIPYSKGGSNTHENIHLVCQNCNHSSIEIAQNNKL